MKILLSGHISKMYQEWRPVLFENAVPNATSLKPDAKPDTKWTVPSKAASYSLRKTIFSLRSQPSLLPYSESMPFLLKRTYCTVDTKNLTRTLWELEGENRLVAFLTLKHGSGKETHATSSSLVRNARPAVQIVSLLSQLSDNLVPKWPKC